MQDKLITCPICSYKAKVSDFLPAQEAKKSKEIGEYHCQGFDTFGPFKLLGGIAKGHPTEEETAAAVSFYAGL